MARWKKHNPERRAWRGRSYRKGGIRIRVLREKIDGSPRADRHTRDEGDGPAGTAPVTRTE